jgi:hypothetical protein
LFISILTASLSYAALKSPNEQQASHLLKLSQWMIWPDSVFEAPTTPIRICILGNVAGFDSQILYQKVNQRTTLVLPINDFKSANVCHILFISQSEQNNLTTILAYTQQYPILTVSDIEDFIVQSGMIQFYNRGNQVRLMFDPQTIYDVGITPQI